MQTNTLFLIDGHAMLYRSYFAFMKNPRINSQGVNTSGIFGFTNSILELIKSQKPSHIGVVFDPKGKTFRHDMYEQYKANRQAAPEDLKASIPHIMEIIQGMNIPVIQVEGYEADDVIGTLAKQAAQEDFTVYMVTPDKDYCQLVEEKIYVYRPRSFGAGIEIMNVAEVNEKFSVTNPLQVIDLLGLWGDSSDNVPGAPGIGEKTAKTLLESYQSIEGIYENIHELKGKQKENLINFKEQVLLSKELVTIKIDVPIEFRNYDFKKVDFNTDILHKKFGELEFKSLLPKIAPHSSVPSAKQPSTTNMQLGLFDEPSQTVNYTTTYNTLETTKHSYYLVNNQSHILKLIDELLQQKIVCVDTETTSLNTIDAQLCGIAFAYEAHTAYYVPFPTDRAEATKLAQLFSPIFSADRLIVGQNIKYDIAVLSNYGICVESPLFDTMVAHYIVQPDGRHKLESLAEQYLHYKMLAIEELIGAKGVLQKSFAEVPLEQAKEYACEDADITLQLYTKLQKELEDNNQLELCRSIEFPLIPVLHTMERNGTRIDSDALQTLSDNLTQESDAIEKEVYTLAGEEFNLNSPKQLGEILFEKLRISEKAKRTKTKQYATGEEVLTALIDAHPIVEHILNYREIKKLLSTYIDALPQLIHPATGLIHTSYNQAIVSTGRLSSTNPNLQNIPIRTSQGKEIRRAFIPLHSEDVFMSADYSQIELRIIAHISNDDNFINAFLHGEDIHTSTASKIFGVPIGEVTEEQRRQAKSANFAISYGSTAFGLSQSLRIARKEAQFLIDGYFAAYPSVKQYMDSSIQKARDLGYVETLYGRRRYLPDIYSSNATVRGFAERNAINAPIQGTAADIIKKAMITIQNSIKANNLQAKLIMQVHDELNFSVPRSEIETMKQIIVKGMEGVAQLRVPLTADIGIGKNWLEAH